MSKRVALVCFAVLIPLACADQGGFTNSGSTVTNPPGTLTVTSQTLTFTSNDGATTIHATFSTSSNVENCSGGGKGGHVTCTYTFTGLFSGVLTVNGSMQAINGSTYQLTSPTGVTGVTGYNSAYTPFYFSNSGQILRADNLNGDNMISYGTQGSDVGQFYGAMGIALDSAGRIYIADTYNGRVVRIDDMNGTNWTSYGSYGSGQGQFMDLSGVSIDPAGRIYVMDTGNNRLVRIDDMNGTNWTTLTALGSGVGQFAGYAAPVAFDAQGRIYVADTGNRRIVRMDDLNGTNWTTLTQSPVINSYIYSMQSPIGVAVDATGKIYIADAESYQSAVIRVDDMTGANWSTAYLGAGSNPHSISVDASGMVLVGGGGAQVVDNMSAVLQSSNALTQFYGPYYVFGATLVPLPKPRPSAVSFTPATLSFTQNMGSASQAQTVTIANFGGSSLNGLSVSTGGGFAETNNCPSTLLPGSNCSVSVTFTPPAAGPVAGTLTVGDDSGNLGPVQTLVLNGTGTAPAASVTPTSLSFQSQVVGTTSNTRNITLQSTGTGPLQVSSVVAAGPFSQSNNCLGSLATGSSCIIQVAFSPAATGSASGSVTITDDAGTQTVTLSGNGSAPVSLSTTSLNFGNEAVGSASNARTVTVSNRLNVALSFASIGITGSADFAIASNTCGASIAAGTNCSVGVTFTPAALGSATGVLTFTDSANTSPQTVSLSGSGSAPVTLSSNSLSFNTTAVGSTSSARSVTLTNQQSVALNFTSIAASSGFSVAGNTCGSSIAAGASCTVGVTFSPIATGTANGTLTFADDAPNSPQSVTLSGTGSAPVTLSTNAMNFGTVTVGTTSSSRNVTVTNRQSSALSFVSITVSSGFAIASNTCGSSINAGANCTVGVTFSPTAAGTVIGTLTFTDAAANSPQSVSLSGSGR